MPPDAAAGFPDARPDLQELEPQCVNLGRGQFCALEMVAQYPKKAIGRGVEKQPKLVGQEAMATQAVGLDLQFYFLDAVFYVAPQHVDVYFRKLSLSTVTI